MKERVEVAKRVSIVTVVVNMILSVLKLAIGFIGNSSAIVADGIHSFTDVFTTVIAYLGVKMSAKQADHDHQYGHEKFEPVMSKILATILFITAILIGYDGIQKIRNASDLVRPGYITLMAAFVSIITKEWMFRYTLKAADQIKSSGLKADAWHHRSDAMSSVGSLVGVGGAILGIKILDPIAAIVIALIIIKVAVEVYKKSIDELMDKSADPETIKAIKESIMSVKGVIQIDMLMTRQHVNMLYVDVEIGVNGDLSLWKAHDISEEVHDLLETEFEAVKHCMVHVNPYKEAE